MKSQPMTKLMEKQSFLLDYNAFSKCLKLLISHIPDNVSIGRNKLCNKILYDLLIWVDDDSLQDATEQEFEDILVDLLCDTDHIIEPQLITLTFDMKYKILEKLFVLFWNKSVQIDDIINTFQQKNDKFSAVIVEIMQQQNRKYSIDANNITFIDAARFYSTFAIQTPLIATRNMVMYKNCMNKITLKSFFQFIHDTSANLSKYPTLYELSCEQQNAVFWKIQHLSDILKWISLVHSKYSSTLSEMSCNQLSVGNVFEAAKYNKWGDINEWNQKWESFKNKWNDLKTINVTNQNIFDDKKSNISSSLIGKKGNKILKSNRKTIKTMIEANNKFLMEQPSVDINLFDIKSYHLIDSKSILDIIKANATPWICYDTSTSFDNKSETFIKFDLLRMDAEIYNKCIALRNRLNVTFCDFEFIASNNILKLIQNLKIKQENLNFQIWYSFDKQFETNSQRKRVLNVIEDIISLLVCSQNNLDDNYAFDDDEKYDIGSIENKFEDQILWKYMQTKLHLFCSKQYLCFKFDEIKVKHIQSLWNKLLRRIEDKIKQYSKVCYICQESISKDTRIELECCGLSLHYNCLKEYIDDKFIKNNGKKVSLKQLSCGICRKQMKCAQVSELFKPVNELYDKVKKIAEARLIFDNKQNDEEITDKNETFYNDKMGYATKLYSIFVCYKCEQPYYGGLNQCIMTETDNDNENNYANERLCSRCIPIKKFDTTCKIHGDHDEYVQWKCRFCCSVATFFCWGSTHMCSTCHWKAYILKNKPKNELIQCPCKSNVTTKLPEKINGPCPLGINKIMKHPPSGEEYCLGCAMCQ